MERATAGPITWTAGLSSPYGESRCGSLRGIDVRKAILDLIAVDNGQPTTLRRSQSGEKIVASIDRFASTTLAASSVCDEAGSQTIFLAAHEVFNRGPILAAKAATILFFHRRPFGYGDTLL